MRQKMKTSTFKAVRRAALGVFAWTFWCVSSGFGPGECAGLYWRERDGTCRGSAWEVSLGMSRWPSGNALPESLFLPQKPESCMV